MNDFMSAADYASSAEVASAAGGILGVILGMGVMFLFIAFALMIVSVIANWKLFKKAGEEGWKAIIPFYNTVVLVKIAGLPAWWALAYYVAAFIPSVGTFICLGISIYIMVKLAKAFGKDTGFAVGLVLLGPIFTMILAFGKAEYQLNKANVDVPNAE